VGVDDALVMDTKEEIFEMNNVSCFFVLFISALWS
jgi:hypothetical protein